MTINISRRQLIGTSSAGIAAAALMGSPAIMAQDDKPTVAVGSKNYTEQLIMGEMVSQLLENGGFPVERQLNLGGTLVAHEALAAGDIHTYVEYTGTGLIAILGLELPERESESEATASATPASGGGMAGKVYDIVAEAYPEELGIEWLEPWGFNNTYALALSRERAEELGVTKVSDLAPIAGDLSIGGDAEVMVREDGVPGLEEAYGFEFDQAVTLDAGLMYSAVDNGDVDVITAFSTDGRIESMDLMLLEDDMEFFPPYFAAPIVRQDMLEQAPEVRDILNALAGTISNEQMTAMNFRADGDGVEHSDIVRDFLIEVGIVEA